MGTSISVFREYIYQVINSNHPHPSKIEEFYSLIEENVALDEHDLTPPTLRGEFVSGDLNWRRNTRNALQSEKDAFRLVNIEEGVWALPRELSIYEEIDADQSWKIVCSNAQNYLEQGTEFSSWIQTQRYKISEVSESAIEIDRLDSNSPQRITPGQIEKAINRLNAAGGSSGRRTLNYTVAIETALVELHPDLNWAQEGDFIHSRKRDSSAAIGYELDAQFTKVFQDFQPDSIEDARTLVARAIAVRQGQPQFRAELLEAYSRRCAVTGTDAIQALEAAHIVPYAGPKTNHVQNGMILRSDVHSLFDRGLLGVEPEEYSVVMSDVLTNSSYSDYEQLRIRLPRERSKRPSADALWSHLEEHDLLRYR
jgi:hypothetical protein